MDAIMAIARKHGLLVIEDAAQGYLSSYRGKPLGAVGHMAALSFHETKNVISGEGGALLITDPTLVERAEIIREKGTNRSKFFRGQVDKYTWVDVGSSFLPSELIAAFLWAQLEEAQGITERRMALWSRYHAAFADAEKAGKCTRPIVPAECEHNAHMYYLIVNSLAERTAFIAALKRVGVNSVFHYVPLHSSPAGQRFGRTCGEMSVTDSRSERLVRLPLWLGMEEEQAQVIDACLAQL
jgi:dTDP-4-amino-4,6-dideoxygalactose transaminase